MFVPGKLFQSTLTFVGKAGAYPRVEHLKGASLRLAPDLSHKHLTRLEKLARDKHSSLIRKFVNYGWKKFHNDPGAKYYKSFLSVI